MFMTEADKNKDGSLSLDEFIGCIGEAKSREDAREAAEPTEEDERSAAVEQVGQSVPVAVAVCV